MVLSSLLRAVSLVSLTPDFHLWEYFLRKYDCVLSLVDWSNLTVCYSIITLGRCVTVRMIPTHQLLRCRLGQGEFMPQGGWNVCEQDYHQQSVLKMSYWSEWYFINTLHFAHRLRSGVFPVNMYCWHFLPAASSYGYCSTVRPTPISLALLPIPQADLCK